MKNKNTPKNNLPVNLQLLLDDNNSISKDQQTNIRLVKVKQIEGCSATHQFYRPISKMFSKISVKNE